MLNSDKPTPGATFNEQLLLAVIDLLDSGDDTGCDGLVCVGSREFNKVRLLVFKMTRAWHGNVNNDE